MHIRPLYKHISSDTAELVKDYQCTFGAVIKSGFQWNGMTANWAVGLPKFGKLVDIASIEHDFIYIYEGVLPNNDVITRKEADVMMARNLLNAGCNPLKVELAYRYVRAFGGLLWKRNNSTKI